MKNFFPLFIVVKNVSFFNTEAGNTCKIIIFSGFWFNINFFSSLKLKDTRLASKQ